MEEKDLEVVYKHNKILYNSKIIEYKGMIYRIENTRIVTANSIFIQDTDNNIIVTDDMKNLKRLEKGIILDAYKNILIFRNENVFYIYKDDSLKSFVFTSDESILTVKSFGIENAVSIQKCVIYKHFFVVYYNRILFLMNLIEGNDVQYLFPTAVIDISTISISNIDMLAVKYSKKKDLCVSLFYYSNKVASSLCCSYINQRENLGINIENINNNKFEEKEADMDISDAKHNINSRYLDVENYCASLNTKDVENLLSGVSNFTNLLLDVDKLIVSDENMMLAAEYCGSIICGNTNIRILIGQIIENIKSLKKAKIQKFDIDNYKSYKLFNYKVERKLFKFLSLDDRSEYLKHIFLGKQDAFIFQKSILNFIYRLSSTRLILEIFNKKLLLDEKIFFHQKVALRKFKLKKEFINQKYTRNFHYRPEVIKSNNLAYKIISLEQNFNRKRYIDNGIYSTNTFEKCLIKKFGDVRILEVLDIMLEDNIKIPVDINDFSNFRASMFEMRAHCNIGSLFLNLDIDYKKYYFKDFPRINKNKTVDKIPEEFLFLNGACLFNHYKNTHLGSSYKLGADFGNGLSNGLSDDMLQNSLKNIDELEDFSLKYYLLILSTRSINDSTKRSININGILKSSLFVRDFEVKKASICSLAIFNRNTHDLFVLELLLNECSRFGPVNLDKNEIFYDRHYRMLAALTCGVVSIKPLNVSLNCSFSELIVNGLSSINGNVSEEIFYRSNDHLPIERFYSKLFMLTTSFSESYESIIEIVNKTLLSDIYHNSARIFYIGLKMIREEKCKHTINWLFDKLDYLEEECEKNTALKILFNFTMISLSIIHNGTCDLSMIKILRRQILKSKDLKYMKKFEFFDFSKKNKNSFVGVDFESIQIYKMCMGIVCSNFGCSSLDKNCIKQLIISFFIDSEISFNFSYFGVLRTLLVKHMKPNGITFSKEYEDVKRRMYERKLNSMFIKEFKELNCFDQKIVVDILSDYYENYHFVNNCTSYFDINMLGELVSKCK